MKTQLIFGCLFAALTVPALYADSKSEDTFLNLTLHEEEETNEDGYLFAFADTSGFSFQLANEEIAVADEDETEETSSDGAEQAEEV